MESLNPRDISIDSGSINEEVGDGKDFSSHIERQFYTTDVEEELPIRMGENGPMSEPPLTVMQVFEASVAKHPNKKALAVYQGNEWKFLTYKQYHERVWNAAKAMIALGLQVRHGVSLLGSNAPEWFIACIGAIYANGVPAGIYTTNSPEACEYVIDHSRSDILFVENDFQLQKILRVRERLPSLKAIVQYTGLLSRPYKNVYTWDQFMSKGLIIEDKEVESRMSMQRPGMCCTLIYTSGTTGLPKAVMLSHDNVTWTATRVAIITQISTEEHVVSYLPLCHIAAQMMDLHVPMMYAATTWFAQPDALKGSLIDTLRMVRPTCFLGVPRVWEKIAEQLMEYGSKSSSLSKSVAKWAKEIGLEGNMNLEIGKDVPWGWSIANFFIFDNIRKSLGLDRCRVQISSAAPISRETLEYFMSVNIPICEIYGMSESSGPQTVSVPERKRTGSCGITFDGAFSKIDNPTWDGSGEICIWGRHVFMGYMGNEEQTKKAIDEQGWLHSGDLGNMDSEGFVYVTGRIKELLITAGGENVAPVPIENRIKQLIPFVSNAMLIGDKRKFLSCLLTLKVTTDANGTPTSNLSHAALQECYKIGVTNIETVSQARENQKIIETIEEGIKLVNSFASSHAQTIQKWCIVPMEFSVASGELGPTLKLRRHFVLQKYKTLIDSLYGVYGDLSLARSRNSSSTSSTSASNSEKS